MARSSQLTTAIVSLVLLLGLQDAYGRAPKRNLDTANTSPSPSPSPRTCGEDYDCSNGGVKNVRKAADTVTAGDTPNSRGGTDAECCEAFVPGTCGNNFDCSGEEPEEDGETVVAKAADTVTADTPGTANECCEAQTYVGEASVTISGITLTTAQSDAFQLAFRTGIADQYGRWVTKEDVTIGTIVEGRRRLSGGVTIPYTITTTDASVAQAALAVNLQMSSLGIKISDTCGTDCGEIGSLQVDSATEFQEVKADGGGSATPTAAAGAATATLLLVLFANI